MSSLELVETGNIEPQIIRESAFQPQLKDCVENSDKSTFNLILSMLCTDAQELDEFHLPNSPEPKPKADLHKQFFIQPSPIYIEKDTERDILLNQLVNDNHHNDAVLALKLSPQGLLVEPEKIDKEVWNNLDVNVQARLLSTEHLTNSDISDCSISNGDTDRINHSTSFDPQTWFNSLQASRAYK